MAVKGTYHIDHLGSPTTEGLEVSCSINGHEENNIVESGAAFTIAPGTTAQMKAAVATAVQAWLVSEHAYSFTPAVDSVEEL